MTNRKKSSQRVKAVIGSGVETPERHNRLIAVSDADAGNPLLAVGGSKSPYFNSTMLRETLATIWTWQNAAEDMQRRHSAAAAALAAFRPKDEIEGMLAAQAVAMHFCAMECLRRAAIPEQPSEVAARLRKDGANLSRAMADMLDALDRKRGRAPQVVRVERVVVQEGGQAIVGNVSPSNLEGGA